MARYGYVGKGSGMAMSYKYEQRLVQARWETWQAAHVSNNFVVSNMQEVLKTIAEMNPYDTSSMEYVVSLAKSAIESLKEKAYECSNFC